MKIESFDVVICGAGPAGSTCALALEKSGLKVALLDRSSFPRDKVCGDAIAPNVPGVLKSIHPKYEEAFRKFGKGLPIEKCRVVAPGLAFVDVNIGNTGMISKRMDYDQFLFDQARAVPNVTVFQNTSVKNIQVSDSEVKITCENDLQMECKMVIGCDGAHSVVRKQLTDLKVDLSHYSGAVRAYYKNVSGIPPKTFELHFLKDILPGYFWIFPLPNNEANVGFGMLSKAISDRKINLRKEMMRIIETVPQISERFKNAELIGEIEGFGLPLGSRKLPVSGKRFMLCGDAASLIDPATGEGIAQAMISGRFAGWHAAECFRKSNFSAEFIKGYDTLVYDQLWGDMQRRYFFQKVINSRPWAMDLLFFLGIRFKWVRKLLKKLVW